MAFYLGIDIGTSAVKAMLVDGRQRIVAGASSPLAIEQSRTGWFEQHPQAWWRAVRASCDILRRSQARSYAAVCAIGLSGQMHGTVLLDRRGRVLRPSILWNDARATAEALLLNREFDDLTAISGIIAMPGFTAPKILWLQRHEPETMRQLACLMQAKDYVRLKLTGVAGTDMSDAAGSLLLDCRERRFSPAIVERCGLSLKQLPTLHEGCDAAGILLAGPARSLGLKQGIVVAAGGGDAAVGAVGIGAVEEGRHFISVGTSGQYFVARERFRPRPGRLVHSFAHCIPDRWFDMAALLNGASCFSWLAMLLDMDVKRLLALAGKAKGEEAKPLFLPYLAGERTPHNDMGLRGSLIGLSASTDAADLARAAVEGVALSFADVACDVLPAEERTTPSGLIGGASQSRLVMQTFANALGHDVVRYRGGTAGAAFGAARLARMAFTGEGADRVCLPPRIEERFGPDHELAPYYARRLKTFRDAYGAFRELRLNKGP